MTDTSKIHLEILDEERRNLLLHLAASAKGFILSGGTALALQICHRKSYDFDFFSNHSISAGFPSKISRLVNINNISVDSADEFTFFTSGNVKVTFLHYPFRAYYDIVPSSKGLNLYSVKDIAVQKAYTIGRRGEYRDYFDLYSILSKGYIDLNELIKTAEQVYGGLFNSKIFLEQLVYFDDLLSFDIIPVKTGKIPAKEEVKDFFESLVKSYLATI